MKAGAISNSIGTGVFACCLLLLLAGPMPAHAQIHATGSAWIHRDAPEATQVHLQTDLACFVDFETGCFGGMMAPDSLFCELTPLPGEEWPDDCPIAIQCQVSDPQGHHVLDGSGMYGHMMRSEVSLCVHYDPDDVERLGLDPETLCLSRRQDGGYEVCHDAVHDEAAATFTLSTFTPGGRYAVVVKTPVGTQVTSWSELKASH